MPGTSLVVNTTKDGSPLSLYLYQYIYIYI